MTSRCRHILTILVLLAPLRGIAQGIEVSHERGFHTEPFDLILTAPPDVAIRYTLDGSFPRMASRPYEGPIRIGTRQGDPNSLSMISDVSTSYATWAPPVGEVFKITVVRMAGFRNSVRVTPVVTRSYIVHPLSSDRYRLPVVSLVTDSTNLFDHVRGIYVNGKIYADWRAANPTATETGATPTNFTQSGEEWERPVHIEFFEEDGSTAIAQDAGVRMHGSWARAFRQKTWRLYAKPDYGPSWFDYRLFPDKDIPRYKRFILRNSGQDWTKTMLRDGFMQGLVRDLGFDTQYFRPVVVFVNGEFWGIHNARDRFDDYYIETHYGVPRSQIDFLELNAVVQDGQNTHYLEMIQFLRFNALNTPARLAQLRTMMDTENYGHYAMAQIYINNRDWPHNNIDYWRKRTATYQPDAPHGHDGRWRWMLKDTDFGFGWNMGDQAWKHDMLGFALSPNGNGHGDWATIILRSLMANPDWRTWFLTRYADLLNTHFSPQRVLAELEGHASVIAPHMQEHMDRWGYNNDRWATPRTIADWQSNLDLMRHFASVRADTLFGFLNARYSLGGKVRITVERPDPSQGHVVVNTVALTDATPGVALQGSEWRGTWFRNLDLSLEAIPAEGMVFVGWEGITSDAPVVRFRPTGDVRVRPVFVSETSTGRPETPAQTRLEPNHPNPFNPSTAVRFTISETHRDAPLRLTVHDIMGREVAVLAQGLMPAGSHSVRFDASGLASGIYLIRLETASGTFVRSVTLLK